jgi:hypothetical protein
VTSTLGALITIGGRRVYASAVATKEVTLAGTGTDDILVEVVTYPLQTCGQPTTLAPMMIDDLRLE